MLLVILKKIRLAYRWIKTAFPIKEQFGSCGENTVLLYPLRIYSPQSVFIGENVKLSSGLHILNAPSEKIIIKKYSVFAANCTIAPNSHVATVTIPQFILGASHVNDKSADVIIDEDVWLGVGCTILSGVHIGRGCIIGAGSLVTKSLPPYSVAVGSPARILRKTFSVEQIMRHEEVLYPSSERFTREELEQNEKKYFLDKNVYGVNDNLDDYSKAHIYRIKQMLHYIEPQ